MTTNQPNIINIQDDTYYFSVFLVNSDNRVLMLRPDAIKQLVIEDNLAVYYDGGYIILDNKFDALEQPSQVIDNTSELNTSGFVFQGGARDILRVEIMPKLDFTPTGSDSDAITNHFFRLSYEFAIYDIEEILGEDPGEKYKKLYFYDIFHQLLSEKNIQFSTSEMSNTSNNSTENRSQLTGDALKYIINKSLNTEDNLKTTFGSFDLGASKVFFSAPTNYKAVDCIEYILERHVSSKNNNDSSILILNRYPKIWTLGSLSDLFKKAYNPANDIGGNLFLEKFMIGGYSGDISNLTQYSVTIERSPQLALYLSKYATLDNFSFTPAAGDDLQQTVNNRNVYNYNFSESTFTIDSEKGDYTNTKSKFYQNYVKPMKGNKGYPVTNLVDNKYRTSRQNLEHIYTTEESYLPRLNHGQNIILDNSVFLNTSVAFRVKGATYRQAGYFISIDRNSASPDCDFDNKLLGIYLIVNVKHIFSQNTYFTDLICVKTYLYKDIDNIAAPL